MARQELSRRWWRFPGAAISLIAVLALIPQAPGAAGVPDGAGELSLDRGSVLSLMTAAMPRTLKLAVPQVGELTLDIEPPTRIEFIDGGIEAELTFTLKELFFTSPIRVRYVPEVEPRQGLLRLVASQAVPELPLPVPVDLAPLLPPVELPRSFSWSLQGFAGQAVPIHCVVQGVEIDDERLVVQLGFAAGK